MEGTELTLKQALENIDLILSLYKGTRQEHFALQESLNKVKKELADKK